jgi:iron complex transport system substrate-binding protein
VLDGIVHHRASSARRESEKGDTSATRRHFIPRTLFFSMRPYTSMQIALAGATTTARPRRALLWSLLGCALIAATGCGRGADGTEAGAKPAASTNERIVTLGGTVTEIVYALGAGPRIIGTDISSTYPDAARKLPQVGYQRTIAAEQVLSLNPTLIIASEDAGPPAAMEQLRNAGVRIEVIHGGHSAEGARQRIEQIARVLGSQDAGRALRDSLDADMATVHGADTLHAARVIYVSARGGGSLQVAGTGTAADAIIALAGGRNAITAFNGYRPLTPEAAIGAAPDVILVSREGFDHLGGADAIAAMPGVAETPAARAKRIVPVDDLYVLGFGPRMGKARAELTRAFAGATTGAGR